MSTNRLGRADDLDKYWSENLLEEGEARIEINDINYEPVWTLEGVNNYPYKGQRKIYGEFTYYIPGRKTDSIAKKGKYSYRAGSGLFMVDTETDRPKAEEVFSAINSQVVRQASIEDRISVNRLNLWRFLDNADSIEELKVRGENGQYDISILLKLVDEEDPEESLKELIGVRDIEYPENILAALQDIDQAESVSSLKELNVDLYKISIVSAKASFWHNDRVATMNYQHNTLSVDAENETAREYALQLFERDVIPPSEQ